MAIYHLNASVIGRSQGRSATGAAAYRAAVRIEDARTGLVFDYTRKRGVDSAEILVPHGDAPDRATLWNLAEHAERRVDAQVAREIVVALPCELHPEQMRDLVRTFVRDAFTNEGMVADIAFHHLAGNNPHAHILLSLREWTGVGFGPKRREWNDRGRCEHWRERWALRANEALAAAGSDARIDHRTLVEQAAEAAEAGRLVEAAALDRVPTVHERGSVVAIQRNAAAEAENRARLAGWQALAHAVSAAEQTLPTDARQSPTAGGAMPWNADGAFQEEMRGRRDLTAARWRHFDRRISEARLALETEAGRASKRVQRRDRAAMALTQAKSRRDQWLEKNPPPWLAFWRGPAWRRRRTALLEAVGRARDAAVRAEQRAAPKELALLRKATREREVELQRLIAARQAVALMPSEQERLDQAQRERQAELRAMRSRVGSVTPLSVEPDRPSQNRPVRRRGPR